MVLRHGLGRFSVVAVVEQVTPSVSGEAVSDTNGMRFYVQKECTDQKRRRIGLRVIDVIGCAAEL